MRFRTGSTLLLLLLLSACATTAPSPRPPVPHNPRLANLQRAAQYPWTDDGQCVVREASNAWPVLAERCFHALDHKRVKFRDLTGRCAVASTGAEVAAVEFCVFAAPELVVGAVVVISAVVVAAAIAEELDEYARTRRANPEAEASSGQVEPVTEGTPEEPQAERRPEPDSSPLGQDWFPPNPPVSSDPSDRRPECTPRRASHRGGNDPHNDCADLIPRNSFPGWDVLVNGKHFDALQLATRTLWEVKTDNFDTYSDFLKGRVIRDQVQKMRSERALALACGFDFRVGVRSEAHQEALEEAAPDLKGLIVVMDWC